MDQDEIIQLLENFEISHSSRRQTSRHISQKENKELVSAHAMALAAVLSLQDRLACTAFETEESADLGQLLLIAQFVRGIDITETAISEALYTQAAALLKQELEILTAIKEHEKKARKNGKTPNITNTFPNFASRYKELNAIAHPSDFDALETLTLFSDSTQHGPSTIPEYDQHVFTILYGLQITFLIMLFAAMTDTFEKIAHIRPTQQEDGLITSALAVLIEQEVVAIA